jgi:hypothetical protein
MDGQSVNTRLLRSVPRVGDLSKLCQLGLLQAVQGLRPSQCLRTATGTQNRPSLRVTAEG